MPINCIEDSFWLFNYIIITVWMYVSSVLYVDYDEWHCKCFSPGDDVEEEVKEEELTEDQRQGQ